MENIFFNKRTVLCSKRKGFMHAIEGVIAAIVLFYYFSSTTLPPLQTNDWTYNSVKQEGTEYINSVERSDTSALLAGDSKVFSEITNALFESSDISIIERGAPPKDIHVGIIGTAIQEYLIVGGMSRNPNQCNNNANKWFTSNPGIDCIVNSTNPLGVPTILVDNTSDGINAYNAVYVDLNGNTVNDPPYEGPFFPGDYVTIGANTYSIKYIYNAARSVKFVSVPAYLKNQNVTINGRHVNFLFYKATLSPSSDLSQYDVLLITSPTGLMGSVSKLKNFLLLGKGIVEVTNITVGNYDAAQSELFGLDNPGYEVTGKSSDVYLSENVRSVSEPLRIKDYFSGIPIRISFIPAVSPPYNVSGLPGGLPPPGSVRVGRLNLTSGNITIAIAKTGAVYDSLYVDSNGSNGDLNFSDPAEDAIPHFAGGSFNTTSGNYTVKAFDPSGTYVDVVPSANARLSSFFNPLKVAVNEDSWASAEQANNYNKSTNVISDSFTITASNPVLGDPNTLPQGVHKYGTLTQAISKISGANYYIAVTNVSGTFFLNIDLSGDGRYDGIGEGAFSNGELVGIGPEKYRAYIANDWSVKFMLYSRDNVPAAIASAKYTGRTVWMPDVAKGGIDSWNYLSAAIIWASPKDDDSSQFSAYHNIVSSKKVFILSGDVFQPYVVEFSRRYR